MEQILTLLLSKGEKYRQQSLMGVPEFNDEFNALISYSRKWNCCLKWWMCTYVSHLLKDLSSADKAESWGHSCHSDVGMTVPITSIGSKERPHPLLTSKFTEHPQKCGHGPTASVQSLFSSYTNNWGLITILFGTGHNNPERWHACQLSDQGTHALCPISFPFFFLGWRVGRGSGPCSIQ